MNQFVSERQYKKSMAVTSSTATRHSQRVPAALSGPYCLSTRLDQAACVTRTPEVSIRCLMMACNLSDPSVEIDTSWWDPIGMRATVSHLVHFRSTFIPDEDLIGYPGQYLKEGWQTCFIPHYAATFLGAAEAAYDYALNYITTQKKIDDPYVQHHIGQMSVNVETAHSVVKTCRSFVGNGQVSRSADRGQPRASRGRASRRGYG